ncbi:hypothetical protein F5141DRAFT_324555 [Pisolithus sp. B1]|nr:hypothetical protein F5141DRAFT_324555 [Pisolithus sp. B1]
MLTQSSGDHSLSTPKSSHFALPAMPPPSSKTDMANLPTGPGANTVLGHAALPTNSLKRTHFQPALPSDGGSSSPHKSVKKLMTTTTASVSEEVEVLRSHRTLQVARATRNELAASVKYHRLRLQEIELMRTMVIDECEEAEALLKAADRQIGEIKHTLNCEGRGALNFGIQHLPAGDGSNRDADCSGSECSEGEDFASPAPSTSDDT